MIDLDYNKFKYIRNDEKDTSKKKKKQILIHITI